VLEPIEQGQLIDKDGAERKATGVNQALGRHLPMSVKDALEMLIEVFDRQRAQLMKDATNFHARVGMRATAILTGDQEIVPLVTRLAYVCAL